MGHPFRNLDSPGRSFDFPLINCHRLEATAVPTLQTGGGKPSEVFQQQFGHLKFKSEREVIYSSAYGPAGRDCPAISESVFTRSFIRSSCLERKSRLLNGSPPYLAQ